MSIKKIQHLLREAERSLEMCQIEYKQTPSRYRYPESIDLFNRIDEMLIQVRQIKEIAKDTLRSALEREGKRSRWS